MNHGVRGTRQEEIGGGVDDNASYWLEMGRGCRDEATGANLEHECIYISIFLLAGAAASASGL